jgi:hypothetical protein
MKSKLVNVVKVYLAQHNASNAVRYIDHTSVKTILKTLGHVVDLGLCVQVADALNRGE